MFRPNYGGIALASWLAGHLYTWTPAHDLPLIYGSAGTLIMLGCWAVMPIPWPVLPTSTYTNQRMQGRRSEPRLKLLDPTAQGGRDENH